VVKPDLAGLATALIRRTAQGQRDSNGNGPSVLPQEMIVFK